MAKEKVGAGWAKTIQGGKELINVKITINGTEHKFVMWKNTEKSKPTSPDYNIVVDDYVKPA